MTTPTKVVQPETRLRPTLVIGLGGTGHRIAVQLKKLVWQSWSADQIEQRIRFLVFDTAREELTANHHGRTVVMEPGSEFHDIGQTPVANIKRNLARQSAIAERMGGVMANLPPTVLRNGAKQLRPLGLLAFLWRYAEIENCLREAIWALAGRQHSEGREGVNVFIVNSLVGGTGSSAFLDVAHVVRDLFDELGSLADFCYVTGVGLLPRAFHGITGPNMIPNAVASLKELNYCMLRGGFSVRYPNGRVVSTVQPPFNIYYLVDGIDERGHTWNGPGEVCRLAAEAIFLQMGSQVGQKHENDFDNLDEVLIRQTEEGDGTFYGSFGLASLIFSGPAVAEACAARQAVRVIEQGLLAPVQVDPAAMAQAVDHLLDSAGLKPGSLAERLACDDQGAPLVVDLSLPGWVQRLSPTAIPGELTRYVRDYEQTRLGVDFKRWLTQNETRLSRQAVETVKNYLAGQARLVGLPATAAELSQFLIRLNPMLGQLVARQAERESQQAGLGQELGHLETAFLQAGESSFLGRKQRVARAQHAYFTAAQNLFQLRWQSQVTTATLAVLNQVSRLIQTELAACQTTLARLQAAGRTLRTATLAYDQTAELAGVTTQSLADEAAVRRLFERYAPPVADTLATLFSHDQTPLAWREAAPAEIAAALLAACRAPFEPVAQLGIEQIIEIQAETTPPESYHTWLMSQATPSWNLDRTRLPDGGSALHRLEVLGVPDESHSIYHRRAKTLVSTGNPARITAFVAHVGVAHTAIQQWDSYQTAYEQARGHTPLHILPQFQANGERARQTFALGSIFGFIKNQGSYFYYLPADALARPVKLAQGLENSLAVFTQQEGLGQEVRERVEQVVAGRGVESILRILGKYYETSQPGGNGRYPADELVLELKRLVRAYADELRQIHQFSPGLTWSLETENDAEVSHGS